MLAFRQSIPTFEEKKGIFSKIKSFIKGKQEDQPTPPDQPTNTTPQTSTTTATTTPIIPKAEIPDLETLGNQARQSFTEDENKMMQDRLEKGEFDMDIFRIQLRESGKMSGYLKYIPGMKKLTEQAGQSLDMNEMGMGVKIIEAMTSEEKKNPETLLSKAFKQKQRICKEANCTPQDINRLLERYLVTKSMYSKLFQLRKEGKPIPSSIEEIKQLIMENGGLQPPKGLRKK